jgi:ABC-type transport system involved in multi-copper enzyme maturation permease subunit
MFKFIFYKELQENIKNFRFILALILCLTIIPLGFYVNYRDFQAKQKNYEESIRLYEGSHKRIGDTIRLGAAAFRPPSPLSILSSGIEFLLPNSIESVGYLSEMGAQTQFNNDRSLDNPYSFLYGYLDLGFMVSVIISVLAMLMTYNSVAGEKERRTLGQILSNAVPRNTVILAKMSASFLLLAVLFFLGILIGIFVLILQGFEIFNPGLFFRFFLGVGFSLLYIFTFLNFGLLVSSLNKSAISSIVSLMFFWVLLFMVLPKGSVILSKIIKPVKSQQVIDLEKNQIRLQIEKEEWEEFQKLRETTPGLREMPDGEFFKKLRAGDERAKEYVEKQNEKKEFYKIKLEKELNKVDSYYDNERSLQAAIAQNISRLSPVSCFIHLMAETSNTGFLEYEQWKKTRSLFKQLLDTEICSKDEWTSFGHLMVGGYKVDRNAPMPKLEYQPVSLHRIITKSLPDFLLLILYGVLFFTGSYVVFLRYDVR